MVGVCARAFVCVSVNVSACVRACARARARARARVCVCVCVCVRVCVCVEYRSNCTNCKTHFDAISPFCFVCVHMV